MFQPDNCPLVRSRMRFVFLLLTLALHGMFKRLAALEKSGAGVSVSFSNTHPASDDCVKVCSRVLSLLSAYH